jgi:hypothetical protein
MMSLIDQQPMRTRGPSAQFAKLRHQFGKKGRPIGELNSCQIDDEVLLGLPLCQTRAVDPLVGRG